MLHTKQKLFSRKILEKLHKEDARLLKDSKKRTMKDKLRRGNQSADFDSGVDDMSISESPDCELSVESWLLRKSKV